MKPDAFVEGIINSVVVDNVAAYTELFASAEPVTDEYWVAARRLYGSLSEADRQVLQRIMRQVAIDSVSTVFGIMDGTSEIAGQFENFELTHKGTRLNGDLQDLFIEAVEESE